MSGVPICERLRSFTPYQLKWIMATPLQQPVTGAFICQRAGISSAASFAHFVRKNPDLFERHGGLTLAWEYRLTPTGAAIADEARKALAKVTP